MQFKFSNLKDWSSDPVDITIIFHNAAPNMGKGVGGGGTLF